MTTADGSSVTQASTATADGAQTSTTPTSSTAPGAVQVAGTQGGSATTPSAPGRSYRKTREGLVVSDKMDKTVVVAVEDRVQHALYKKTLRRTNKLKAHDEANACGIGDRVLLMETRPLSATKRWRVVEILEKAK